MMSTMLSMTDRHQAASYPLRLPAELKKTVEESAQAQGRSLNAEIVARLAQSFVRQDDPVELHWKLEEGARALALARSELEVLRDALKIQRESGEMMGAASVMVANMLRSAIAMLPAEVKERHPEVRVWEACADAVIHGSGAALMESLRRLNSGDAGAATDVAPRARRVYDKRKKP